jgi:hypothetical protein
MKQSILNAEREDELGRWADDGGRNADCDERHHSQIAKETCPRLPSKYSKSKKPRSARLG